MRCMYVMQRKAYGAPQMQEFTRPLILTACRCVAALGKDSVFVSQGNVFLMAMRQVHALRVSSTCSACFIYSHIHMIRAFFSCSCKGTEFEQMQGAECEQIARHRV